MMDFKFEEATREAIKLRMALKAIAGGGKTYSALALMTHILGEPGPEMTKRIALIDTERGSSRRYAKGRPFHFSVLELKSFEPETFVKAIRAAADAGFEGVIIDSLSHEWAGTGGALEQSDNAKKRGGNAFAAWGDITKRHNAVLDAITDSPIHVIATMRTKTTYEQTEDAETKKKTVRKLGLQPVQRDGVEYEFDILLDLDADNVAYVEKTRCMAITGKTFRQPGKDLGKIIRSWLDDTDTQPAQRKPEAEPTRPGTQERFPPIDVVDNEAAAAKALALDLAATAAMATMDQLPDLVKQARALPPAVVSVGVLACVARRLALADNEAKIVQAEEWGLKLKVEQRWLRSHADARREQLKQMSDEQKAAAIDAGAA